MTATNKSGTSGAAAAGNEIVGRATFNLKEAAQYLGVSTRTLRRIHTDGRLPAGVAVVVSKRTMYGVAALAAFVAAGGVG